MTAWSYTALTAYETCPKRYYLTRVSKQVKEPQTEATIWGNRVHGALENRIKSGANMPEGMEQWASLADKMRAPKRGGTPFTELRLCVTKNFTPTKWAASDAWCRGIVDAGIVRGDKMVAIDWKTGKRKPDSDQMKLFAGLLFAHYPAVQKIKTAFIWLKDRKLDRELFTREDISGIWNTFLPRVQRLDSAYADGKWVARPSGLCREWCPVGRSLCEYCGRG